jgi:hypothetical protein
MRATLAMPLTVVRLVAPVEEIERRLSASVTAGRQDDLEVAKRWLTEGRGETVEGTVIENTGPIREVALQVLSILDW